MKQLDDYNKAEAELLEYFGFKEGWTVYPVDDRREYWWELNAVEVRFYDSMAAKEQGDGHHTYTNEILYHAFYEKAVYEGQDYTMIMVDTHVDGNKFLAIYDNSKKINNKFKKLKLSFD